MDKEDHARRRSIGDIIMTDVYDQYGASDEETVRKPAQTIPTLKRGSFINEIKIGDQTLTYVSPEYIEFIARKITELETKNSYLESELNTVKSSNRQRDTYFNNAIKQINARFGFNG